jgi:7-cyano-7-deazaguanine reductase
VFDHLRRDLALAIGAEIELELVGPDQFSNEVISEFSGIDLDKLDIEIDRYQPDAAILKLRSAELVDSEQSNQKNDGISERVFSRLLKSNCPVTDQPDWACIEIEYTGPAIDHASLLRYIVSYRTHSGFHEHCVEKIFVDILKRCSPSSLSVYARYTRRGGLDINPWRATPDVSPPAMGRSARQ